MKILGTTVKRERKNHIQRIETSSDDHRNVMIEIVVVVAIVSITAKNHQNLIRRLKIIQNHHLTIVQNNVTLRHRIVRIANDSTQQHHQMTQMVCIFFIFFYFHQKIFAYIKM